MRTILSAKLLRITDEHGEGFSTISHWCPACKELHDFAVDKPFRNGSRWNWNLNPIDPTFTPSMNIKIGPRPDGRTFVCHYFLKAGVIEYLSDCTHGLASTTVPLPCIPEAVLNRGSH